MDIYDKIREIKQLAIDTDGKSTKNEKNLLRIIGICENILIDHQTRQALEKLGWEERMIFQGWVKTPNGDMRNSEGTVIMKHTIARLKKYNLTPDEI